MVWLLWRNGNTKGHIGTHKSVLSVGWDKVGLLHGFAGKIIFSVIHLLLSWNTTGPSEESTLQAPRAGTRLPPPISSSYIRSSPYITSPYNVRYIRSSPYITSPYNVRYIRYVSSLSIHISCWLRSYFLSPPYLTKHKCKANHIDPARDINVYQLVTQEWVHMQSCIPTLTF